jgi:hypothetical protein
MTSGSWGDSVLGKSRMVEPVCLRSSTKYRARSPARLGEISLPNLASTSSDAEKARLLLQPSTLSVWTHCPPCSQRSSLRKDEIDSASVASCRHRAATIAADHHVPRVDSGPNLAI